MGAPLEPREEQVAEVIARLQEEYPDATISPDFSNRLELLVVVVLSAQCPDERVDRVTADLIETWPTSAEFATADVNELDEAIGSITYHRNKATWLKSAAGTIVEEHNGEVPDTMEELTDLAGVGRRTANVVLQHGHDTVESIVVDTHVQRLTRRLAITEEESPEKMERGLVAVVPEEHW